MATYQPPSRAEFELAIQKAKKDNTGTVNQWRAKYLDDERRAREQQTRRASAFLSEHYILNDGDERAGRIVDLVYVKQVPMPFTNEVTMDTLLGAINHLLEPCGQRAWFDRCGGHQWTVGMGCGDCKYDEWQAREDTHCLFKVKLR